MRMKEDVMNNGQTKPGYNVQISTENQHITNYGIFWNPNDQGTLIPYLDFIYYKKEKSDLGYISTKSVYMAKDCSRCPLRGMCYKGKTDRRIIEVNHKNNAYRAKARELLTSEKGLEYRSRRPIEPEAVFGNIKFNHGFKRFRLKSAEKVSVEWRLVAIAHNLRKYIARKTENSNSQRLFIAPIGAYLECCRAA